MIERSYLSREHVEAEVTATGSDGIDLDPATLPVEFAFVAVGTEPGDADWHPAEHLRGNVSASSSDQARSSSTAATTTSGTTSPTTPKSRSRHSGNSASTDWEARP
jgi:hypothetical protein